jgi:hypothetical protein
MGRLVKKALRCKWLVSAVLVVALLPMAMGCYGNFKLTKSVYEWNGNIENEYVESGVMIGMIIIPVYEFCMLADVIVFNVLEFWGEEDVIPLD